MTSKHCTRLADFLDNDLPPAERDEFLAHLPDCPPCRDEVREHLAVREILTRAVAASKPAPQQLSARIERKINASRRRRAVALLAAAALLLLGAGLTFWWFPPREKPAVPKPMVKLDSPRVVPEKNVEPKPPHIEVVFEKQKYLITVPVKTDNPNITMIWVYPAVRFDEKE
jgi:anti-sigma factor RsiW